MSKSTEKNIVFVVLILGTIIFETLFIVSACIPNKVNVILSESIINIENQMNEISEEYTDQVLDSEKVKALISDSKQIRSYLDNRSDVNFFIEIIGINTYIAYLEDFRDEVDKHLQEFEASGTPFTLHNIFDYLLEQSKTPVLKATKIIEIIVLVCCALFLICVVVAVYLIKNGHLTSQGSSITFGDEI